MKLQDYINYYIGCRCVNTWFQEGHKEFNKGWVLSGYCQLYVDGGKPFLLESENEVTWTNSIKPILRKVGDYEVDELNEYQTMVGKRTDGVHSVVIHYDTPETFHWLLKKGFDLFGLIDAGLAIDSKTLK